jgi:hypothetical protein
MKNALACLLICFTQSFCAQICSIDFNQSVTGIYPNTLPPGNVGQTYGTDITFVMPLDTISPISTFFRFLCLLDYPGNAIKRLIIAITILK